VAQAVSGADLPAVLAAFVTATDAPVAIAAVTDGGFPLVYVNAAFEQTFGAVALATTGSPAPDPQALGLRQVVEAMGHASESGRPAHPRLSHPGPGGRTGWYDMTITPVGDGSGRVTHVVCLAHDVTDLVAANQQAVHAGSHDALTGLANRAHFTDRLDQELARASRTQRSVAVLFLDVDRLKAVNDSLGHAAGDTLLVQTAERLQARLRGQDLAARYGGDEFAILLVDLPHDAAAATALVVDELTDVLAQDIAIAGSLHAVSVSIGASLYPHDATTAQQLIDRADAAMYEAKSRGSSDP
jgi:diguanylate cyclase (GGDEF)-like protein/PAS domain S-box-containing protein